MASAYPNLIDLASRLDRDGQIAPIAEVLSKNDPILTRLGWKECNLLEGYKHSIRTGLPEATWRKLYQGVQPSKSTTTSVTDTCGNLEAYSEVDKDLADINGNSAAWRMSEVTPFIAVMGTTMAETLFYGDSDVHPERFTGLAARYNTLNAKTPSSHNVVNAGGTSSDEGLTSVFIVNMDKFYGIYPKGSKVGLQHTDKGQVTVTKEDGSMYEAYRDHYKWMAGATLEDWRACVRICNIPLKDGAVSLEADKLIKLLITAKNKIPTSLRQNLVMFVPAEVNTALELAAYDKSNAVVKIVEAAEQFKTAFFSIPIEACDSISLKEVQVK